MINEIKDVWDDSDIDSRDGENELRLTYLDPTVRKYKLNTFYKQGPDYESLLYFYKRDRSRMAMLAISFGFSEPFTSPSRPLKQEYNITDVSLEYDENGDFASGFLNDSDFDNLTIADDRSIRSIIKNIFTSKKIITNTKWGS